MAKILEGRTLAQRIAENLKKEIAELKTPPCLAIVQIGEREESSLYIKKKKEFGEKIGAKVEHFQFPENIEQERLEQEVRKLNNDNSFHGVIVQLPLPDHLDFNKVLDQLDFQKDVDGLSAVNIKKLWNNENDGLLPATAKGVLNLLDFYGVSLLGKRAVVLGRSALVGKPISICFLNRNATVTIAHSQTQSLNELTKQAEILVSAVGRPKFITKDYVSAGQVIIDVGINSSWSAEKLEEEIESKKMVGDVDFDGVKDIVEAITPVPGGVGPLTVASLFENLLIAYGLRMKNLLE